MTMTRPAGLLMCALLLAGCTAATPPPDARSPSAIRAQPATRDQPGLNPIGQDRQQSNRRRSRRNRPAADSQPGNFDFYLLTLSWSPEFCATHPGSNECATHPGFVVHGLWPQNADGTYPENCSNAPGPSNPQQYLNLIPTLSLIQHEWATHGTCSGLAPDPYFGEIRSAFHQVKIPSAFAGDNPPASAPPGAVLDQFAATNPDWPKGSLTLSCGRNYLTAVEVCLSKTLTPETCQNVPTCGATVVKITPRK